MQIRSETNVFYTYINEAFLICSCCISLLTLLKVDLLCINIIVSVYVYMALFFYAINNFYSDFLFTFFFNIRFRLLIFVSGKLFSLTVKKYFRKIKIPSIIINHSVTNIFTNALISSQCSKRLRIPNSESTRRIDFVISVGVFSYHKVKIFSRIIAMN